MPYILHIDTTTAIGYFTLSKNGKVIETITHAEKNEHAAASNFIINDLITNAKITFQNLAAIAVCTGPGSYTGLKIGMAIAKGFCYALDLPLLAYQRLNLFAQEAFSEGSQASYIAAIILARKNEFFVNIFDKNQNEYLIPTLLNDFDLFETFQKINNSNLQIITDQDFELKSILAPISNHINWVTKTHVSDTFLANHTLSMFNQNNFTDLKLAIPFYLKEVYISSAKNAIKN